MTGNHYEPFELLAYLDFNGDVVDVAAVSLHLSACAECGANLEDLRNFTAFLSDRGIYELAMQRRQYPRRRDVDDVAWRLRRASEEDDCAEQTFGDLSRVPILEWRRYIAARPSAATAGLVRRLLTESREELNRSPEEALELLDVAKSVAQILKDTDEAIECSGFVAREVANALRKLGRYPEALQSLDVARAFLSRLPAATYDLTFVDWACATILFCMTRYAEALPLVRSVAKTFRLFGETGYAKQAELLEANVLCEQGSVGEARSIYSKLLPFFETVGNKQLIARLHANLAECEVRLDHPDAGRELAEKAMRAYEEIGNVTERVRVRWTLGYSLLRQGYLADAFDALHGAAAEFEALGMTTDAATVGLDIAELHISRGEWSDAERLARYIVGVFSAADAPVHHTRALAYLRDAVVACTATSDLLDYVRRYLADAAATLDDFAPPESGASSKPV